MGRLSQQRLQALANQAAARSTDATRRKCFVSYHAIDFEEVANFLDTFGDVFISRAIGVTDEDDFIDSSDTDYVMNCIREKYLADSTVTIVLIGKCTWARRYVDWEIYSSLRRDKVNRLNGLMALTLPSVSNDPNRSLPPRLADNCDADMLYARWWKYPASKSTLRQYIETAFAARTTLDHLINNSRSRKIDSSPCP